MDLRAFDLNLLRVLDALLRERSTVRAGQAIGLSQPAVSAALSRLRAAFGDPLLVREGRTMRLTDFAMNLAGPLADLLETTGRLLAPMTFDPARAIGTFRLAGADAFTTLLLPPLMARLTRDAPGMQLRYTDAISRSTLDDLRDGRLDLHLMPVSPLPAWLEAEPVLEVASVVIARAENALLRAAGVGPGEPIPRDVFLDLPHAAFRVVEDAPEMDDRVVQDLQEPRRVVLSVASFAAVWQAVAATDMLGIIPLRLAERVARGAGLVVHPAPFKLATAQLSQIWHRRNTANRAQAWLRQQVRELLAEIDDGPARKDRRADG